MSAPESPTLSAVARPVFLHWERLRVPYNVVLLVLTVYFHRDMLDLQPGWPILYGLFGLAAMGANLCFFAAPVVETYLAWLGVRSQWITIALFAGGVLISIPLVFIFPALLH